MSRTPVTVLLVMLTAAPVQAFCGFYAGSASGELTASASRVVLMRDGTRTVLTMQNHYEGPPASFALVVPVPTVITEDQVRALDPSIFEQLDTLTSPRIVEYQQEPPHCQSIRARMPTIRSGTADVRGVHVEQAFSTAEYDIVVLSASDSMGLEAWLRSNGYQVPEGASEALRPYVEAGTKFFVARVNVSRVHFEDGRAVLSPLRVQYDSPQLTLPIRLGVLNSRGEQDLIVYVIGRHRFEVANRRGYFAPTNIEVAPDALPPQFEGLYEHVFEQMMAAHPDSVITEYAWTGGGCDPCPPSGRLDLQDLNALGGDVVSGTRVHREGPLQMNVDAERRSGVGSTEEGVEAGVARQLGQVASCIGALSEIVMEVDVRLGRGGLLQLSPEDQHGGPRSCIARRLRGARIDAPPLNVGESTWHLSIALERAPVERQDSTWNFVVTRLRTRVRKDGRIDDLVFRRARPAYGGRDTPDEQGHLRQHVRLGGERSSFQSRFVVLHRTDQTLDCSEDERRVMGTWFGRPPSRGAGAPAQTVERVTSQPDFDAMIRAPIHTLGRGGRPLRRRTRATRKSVGWTRRSRLGGGAYDEGSSA